MGKLSIKSFSDWLNNCQRKLDSHNNNNDDYDYDVCDNNLSLLIYVALCYSFPRSV